MELVQNNTVKMEWDKKYFLMKNRGSGLEPAFVMAAHDYVNSRGETISVFFCSNTAFLFLIDDEDESAGLFDAKSLIKYVKSESPEGFPLEYDQYVPIIPEAEDDCLPEVLAKYGLEAHADDIKARRLDVEPYGYLEDFKM